MDCYGRSLVLELEKLLASTVDFWIVLKIEEHHRDA